MLELNNKTPKLMGAFSSGSAGVSGITTQGSITMAVDYATGTQPPVGTIVTTQAEYDALGYILKYGQDVFNILPPYIDHSIYADFAAGFQYANGDKIYGAFDAFLVVPYLNGYFTVDISNPPTYGGHMVMFRGALNTIESNISGTFAGKIFTRDSGTWSIDALRGKYFNGISGANSGKKYLIRANDATTFTLVRSASNGVAVVDTYDLASKLSTKIDGGSGAPRGISSNYNSTVPIQFQDLQFGSLTDQFSVITVLSGVMIFNRCALYQDSPMSIAPSKILAGGDVKVFDSYWGGSDGGIRAVHSGCLAQYCFFDYDDYAIALSFRGEGRLNGCYINPGSYTGNVIQADEKSILDFGAQLTIIEGNNLCTGIRLRNASYIDDPQLLQIDDCAIAAQAVNTDINLNAGFIGSGNTIGYEVINNSSLKVPDTNLSATTFMEIDGQAVTVAELANDGDEIIGPLGSRVLR